MYISTPVRMSPASNDRLSDGMQYKLPTQHVRLSEASDSVSKSAVVKYPGHGLHVPTDMDATHDVHLLTYIAFILHQA